MRVLVTGAAGFIGSALVRRLSAEGHEVRALDNFTRGRRNRLDGTKCDVVYADIRDEHAVTDAMRGCDTVAHLAFTQGTRSFYEDPKQVLDVGLRGMLNVLGACEQTGCGDLLLVSSSEVYQTPPVLPAAEDVPLSVPDVLNPRYSYGGGKIACELAAAAWQRAGVLDRAVIARPHNVYGPDMGREHVIPQFCQRMNVLEREHPDGVVPFLIQGTGEETRAFCYIDDCIGQLALLLDKAPPGPSVWHVGTGDEITIAGVARCVAAVSCGREIKIIPSSVAEGSTLRRVPDTGKIEALGWDASQRTSFATGLAETVAWYREHG